MIYLYLISVIVSLAILLGCQWFVMSHYSGGSDIKVNVEDAFMLLVSLMASLLPVGNVVVAAIAAFFVFDVGDIQLFTIKKSKKSPTQHQSFCPVCKNFH